MEERAVTTEEDEEFPEKEDREDIEWKKSDYSIYIDENS
jgi:hypothetical protein